MGVNASAVYQLYFVGEPGKKQRLLTDAILPGLGFLFCFWIWWNLALPAKVAGGFGFSGG